MLFAKNNLKVEMLLCCRWTVWVAVTKFICQNVQGKNSSFKTARDMFFFADRLMDGCFQNTVVKLKKLAAIKMIY